MVTRAQTPATLSKTQRPQPNSAPTPPHQGIKLSQADGAELARLTAAFHDELKPSGEVEKTLVRRLAVCSIRMDRGASHEIASTAARVRQAEADFVPPEGADAARVAALKDEARALAMFDTSKEAILARKYEAAAERGFFRALKELRQLRRRPLAVDPGLDAEASRQELASFLASTAQETAKSAKAAIDLIRDPLLVEPTPKKGAAMPASPRSQPAVDAFHVPFAIGKPR